MFGFGVLGTALLIGGSITVYLLIAGVFGCLVFFRTPREYDEIFFSIMGPIGVTVGLVLLVCQQPFILGSKIPNAVHKYVQKRKEIKPPKAFAKEV